MLIGMHDRINGHANRIRVLDRFLIYATSHEDVWFARKDERCHRPEPWYLE
jgi:peptidoglycan/xylan/chitin deacetylase (PgdA/CDA1 family)